MTNSLPGPLDGITVVSLEQAVAAPFATSRLADAGAKVIKVERPGDGDFARNYDSTINGLSAYFVWLNRGKKSIQLDIKGKEDRKTLDAILADADVFIQNLAPGALAKIGLNSTALRARFPKLITCDITGYGNDGPMKNAKAYDLLVQCESGLASITGTADGPGRVGISVVDIATGLTAQTAILEALMERNRTGRGEGVSVSMFDTMADWMAVPLLHHDYAGRETPRVGLNHPVIYPYGAFTCQDGKEVVISIQNEREWQRLCDQVLEQPDLATDPRSNSNEARAANRIELEPIVEGAFATHTRSVMVERLSAADIAFGAVNDVASLADHPQLDRIRIESPTGPIRFPAPPIRRHVDSGAEKQNSLGSVPAAGADNEAILQELAQKNE